MIHAQLKHASQSLRLSQTALQLGTRQVLLVGASSPIGADPSILLDYWRGDSSGDIFELAPALALSLHSSLPSSTPMQVRSVELHSGDETLESSRPVTTSTSVRVGMEPLPLLQSQFSPLKLHFADSASLFLRSVQHFSAYCTDHGAAMLPRSITHDAVMRLAERILNAYRPNPYHNWRHAIGVLHCVVMLLDRTAAGRALSALDALAFLLAAVAHDVDHRGFTNAYETLSLSELSLRYNTSSVLEHHHAALLCSMLCKHDTNSSTRRPPQGAGACNNVFNLSRDAFAQLRNIAVTAILSTDSEYGTCFTCVLAC
jgi:hypothetical protein